MPCLKTPDSPVPNNSTRLTCQARIIRGPFLFSSQFPSRQTNTNDRNRTPLCATDHDKFGIPLPFVTTLRIMRYKTPPNASHGRSIHPIILSTTCPRPWTQQDVNDWMLDRAGILEGLMSGRPFLRAVSSSFLSSRCIAHLER